MTTPLKTLLYYLTSLYQMYRVLYTKSPSSNSLGLFHTEIKYFTLTIDNFKINAKKETRINSCLLKRHNTTKKHIPINYFIGAPNRNRTSDTPSRNFIPIKLYINYFFIIIQ